MRIRGYNERPVGQIGNLPHNIEKVREETMSCQISPQRAQPGGGAGLNRLP